MEIIDLISPEGTSIVGFLKKSGATCPVECKYAYKGGEHSFNYKVPEGAMAELAMVDGDRVFVDEKGKQWSTIDVEFASTPPRG